MKPSWKDPEVEKFLESQFGRTTSILANKCINPPHGCGKPIVIPFSSPIFEKEYTISGRCEACQRTQFGDGR